MKGDELKGTYSFIKDDVSMENTNSIKNNLGGINMARRKKKQEEKKEEENVEEEKGESSEEEYSSSEEDY